MFHRLLTLARHSVVYGLGSIAAKLVALILLPLYVRYLSPADYGAAETIFVVDLFAAALLKLGLQNSLMRFYFDSEEREHQQAVVWTVFWTIAAAATLISLLIAASSGLLAQLFLENAGLEHLFWIGAFGIWCSAIYQTLQATFRLQQRPRPFATIALVNIAASALFSVVLVVGFGWGASGLLLGNFLGTFICIPWVAISQRALLRGPFDRPLLGQMLRYGVPTMPLGVVNQGLHLLERVLITRLAGLSQLGLFAVAARASQVVMLLVMALQLSWQPFAYSIKDDADAKRTYAFVMSYYLVGMGLVIVAVSLFADPIIRLLTVPRFYGSATAIPLLALAAGIYGIYFVAGVGAGRVKKTGYHVFVALGALIVSVSANLILIPRFGILGAAITAVLGNATLATLMVLRSQHVFAIPYHWRRDATTLLVMSSLVCATYLIPPGELWTLPLRAAGVAAFPLLLVLLGAIPPKELRGLRRRTRAFFNRSSPTPA